MKRIVSLILTVALLSMSVSSFALSAKLFPTRKPDKSFKVSSKSRTIEMRKGQTYHLKMKLRKNRYYFIYLKGKKKLGPVQCIITIPEESNKVVFDNAAYEFEKNILFYNKDERDVVVEIKTMPCCYESKLSKKQTVKLVFANKKIKKDEIYNTDNSYNLYAVN
ncbi:MAG: hypothetical protein L3J35_09650 [Bacteroidales bacterium]|nr:hypothetical protein [Bacteroidales bacterium]